MSRRSETTTKVFVGSLPVGVTPDDLRTLFAPYGAIAECDIANRCGFLHLEDHDLAMKAIAELNGTNFMGGRISVEKGRIKPRRSGGPMRGGKDRSGPYSRGGDFRGHRNGGFGMGGGGGVRDFPPYGGGGDRFGYDRPPRGPYDGGYGDRRPPPFDDRRGGGGGGVGGGVGGGFPGDRRSFGEFCRRGYPDDRAGGFPDNSRDGYDDRRPPVNDFDDRRPLLNDRRPLLDPQVPSRGPPPPTFDRGGPPVPDLFSRRDQGMKPMGSFNDVPYSSGPANGYSYGSSGGYSSPGGGPPGGYGGGNNSFSGAPNPGFNDRGYGGGGYRSQGGYGDSYGGAGVRGSYDAAYPPLPNQRGGFASGGGPGPRRDMAPGRRF